VDTAVATLWDQKRPVGSGICRRLSSPSLAGAKVAKKIRREIRERIATERGAMSYEWSG
jgi:hypothetical protein